MPVSIQYLSHSEIDKERWDNCIQSATNGRIYGLSWYLDAMAPSWNALISGNYEIVMPLPIRKKWGISYVFQPAFTQQLGIFSATDIDCNTSDLFLTELQKHFRYAEVNANPATCSSKFTFTTRKNYLLHLSEYASLSKKYSRSAKRNIEKAKKNGITIIEDKDPTLLMDLHKARFENLDLVSANEYEQFLQLLKKAVKENVATFLYAKTTDGKVLASSGYLHFNNRRVFIVNGNSKESLDSGAAHLLKDYAIQKFAGLNLTMDFEGSDTPSFARFYEQYGAEPTDSYPFFIFNNLPAPIKWLKKIDRKLVRKKIQLRFNIIGITLGEYCSLASQKCGFSN